MNVLSKSGAKLLLPTCAVFLAVATAALAEKKEVRVADGLTASQFAQNCDNMGGEIDDGASGGFKCTLPSGTSADCNFGPKDAYCEVTTPGRTIPRRPVAALLGNSAGSALSR